MRSPMPCAIACVLLILAACSQPDPRSTVTAFPASTAIAVSTVGQSATITTSNAIAGPTPSPNSMPARPIVDYLYESSFESMVQRAPVIVIADLISPAEVINLSRDLDDVTKPATDSFIVGQVYVFHIRRYLKGTGAATINIVQSEGMIFDKKAANVTAADIEQARKNYDYMPFRPNVTYLLVLSPQNYLGSTYYGGRPWPWRFVLGADGRTIAEGPQGSNIGADFGYNPDLSQLAQIEQLVKAEPSATPAK